MSELCEQIVRTMADAVIARDLDHRVMFCNPAVETLTGYSCENLRRLPPSTVAFFPLAENGDISGPARCPLVLTIETRTELNNVPYAFVRRDGTQVSVRVSTRLLHDPSGTDLRGAVATLYDATLQERQIESVRIASRQNAARRDELEQLLSLMPDMLTRALPDSTLIFVNARYAAHTGRSAEELIGSRFLDVCPPRFREQVASTLAGLTPENPAVSEEQLEMQDDGTVRCIWWTNVMMYDEWGQAREIISMGRDVTELWLARETIARQARDLERSNSVLREFSAMVSHDLKAPMRQVNLFAEMLTAAWRGEDVGQVEDWMSGIGEKIAQMNRQLNSLSEFSRMTHAAPEKTMVRLHQVVAEAISILEASVAESQAVIDSAIDEDLVVECDAGLMVHVFQNLIGNAIKYVAPGDTPKVTIREEPNDSAGTVISVADEGIGVDHKDAGRLFNVFTRLHNDESVYAGGGIGLAICRHIVESHGGSIWLDLRHGDGAKFCFYLPHAAGLFPNARSQDR